MGGTTSKERLFDYKNASIPCSAGGGGQYGCRRPKGLRFHSTHGDNIKLLRDGTKARRAESFCKGITFSHRPIKAKEYVYIKFSELSVNWSGAIRFGFTCNNPSGLQGTLPKYVCPDLINKPGFWAKALPERLVEQDAVLFFYYTVDGDVRFGLNDQEMGVFFTGVDVRERLWAVIDVYGNTLAVEFVDSGHSQPLNNARSGSGGDLVDANNRPAPATTAAAATAAASASRVVAAANRPTTSHYHPRTCFSPLPFHRVHGRHVRLSNDQQTAVRDGGEYSQGYVFSSRPLQCGERFLVQVQLHEESYVGGLAFGLTSCDPSALDVTQLPDDSEQLLDRKEYWVVVKDIANAPRAGDELSFTITRHGEVQFSCNGGPFNTIMYVDQTQRLWAFFDLYGSTQKLRTFGCMVDRVIPRQSELSTVQSQHASPLRVSLPPSKSDTSVHAGIRVSLVESEATMDNVSNECVVCCERPVDSVLYTCGHMCMCYDCAHQLFERPGGQCPICRSAIRDVIRTYRS